MLIGNNLVVSINYVLKNDQGETMDASPEGEPLSYLHGASGIVPGLENELTGKTAGDTFEVTIKPEEAYGEKIPELIQDIPVAQFPPEPPLAVGMQFNAETPNGPIAVTITAINGDTVTVDGNHPLAGHVLHFTGSIESVREATEEEKSHGHAH